MPPHSPIYCQCSTCGIVDSIVGRVRLDEDSSSTNLPTQLEGGL